MSKIVVLVSGGGSNLQSIIDKIEAKELNATITTVIADREAGGLARAEKHGIANYLVDRKIHKKNLSMEIDKVIPEDTDLIVLAGYLSIISKEFTEKWNGKIINIHPSLLPKYGGKGMYGLNVHKAVVEAGENESGCTVHYVNAGIDTGATIAVAKVPVLDTDTAEDLQKRVLAEEHRLLPECIKKVLNI
jgi:phosphoribosylglycinamide formyltransferase-1